VSFYSKFLPHEVSAPGEFFRCAGLLKAYRLLSIDAIDFLGFHCAMFSRAIFFHTQTRALLWADRISPEHAGIPLSLISI
jgi:hypothetical protein